MYAKNDEIIVMLLCIVCNAIAKPHVIFIPKLRNLFANHHFYSVLKDMVRDLEIKENDESQMISKKEKANSSNNSGHHCECFVLCL